MMIYYLCTVGLILLGACLFFGYQGDERGCRLYGRLFVVILILAVVYEVVSRPDGKCFYF